MNQILFLTHDTRRTGAPLVLLYFLEWLRQSQPQIEIIILALEGGVLTDRFKKVTKNYFELPNRPKSRGVVQEVKNRFFKKIGIKKDQQTETEKILKELSNREIDIIYANTVVSVPIASRLKGMSKNSKLVVHVHELESVIKTKVPGFSKYLSKIDFYFSASNIVEQNLIQNYNIIPNSVETIYEFTKLREKAFKGGKKPFLVGGAGWVYWRKGPDLFIQVAQYIHSNYPNVLINFQWVGTLVEEQKTIIEADLFKSGLENIVSFVGEIENPDKYYSDFDVFLLTSREDPFPLVCIEVGMMGKPIICFEEATGTSEVLQEGGGFIVPYLDIKAMAEKVMFYYKNEKEKIKDGEIAVKIFSQFTPENQCPRIYERISEL